MKKLVKGFFLALVVALAPAYAAQRRRGRRPTRLDREREFNFLSVVERQLQRSQVLLERENLVLQYQPAQAAQGQPRRPAQQQGVVPNELRRQLRNNQRASASGDMRSANQKKLHSGLSIEQVRQIVQEQEGNGLISLDSLSADLSQVVILPASNEAISLESAKNLIMQAKLENPFTRIVLPDEFTQAVLATMSVDRAFARALAESLVRYLDRADLDDDGIEALLRSKRAMLGVWWREFLQRLRECIDQRLLEIHMPSPESEEDAFYSDRYLRGLWESCLEIIDQL